MFQRFGKDAFAEEKRLIALRRMIWRYFVMLIGEGALRQWIVPSPVVAYFLLLSSFTLLGLFQMVTVGQLDSVRSAKNVQPI
jgi:hypothetical protein